jgi:hypothetical protein
LTEYPYKRFLVFAGDGYYPCGGFNDYKGTADTLDEAKELLRLFFKDNSWGTWSHVVDLVTGEKKEFRTSDFSDLF